MAATPVQPYFLPGLALAEAQETALTFGTVAEPLILHAPVLTPAALATVSQQLLEAQASAVSLSPAGRGIAADYYPLLTGDDPTWS
jgi:hypothetical protein